MKKLLVVEDDPNLGNILKETLAASYQVSVAATLTDAFDKVEQTTFDLIIIDRLLPDGDAIGLIRFVHDSNYQTRILAISRMYQPNEKIRGLEQGADDYLPKPFSLGELKLKVKKMLSYQKLRDSSSFSLGPLSFSPDSGSVQFDGKTAILRKKESAILECLFKYRNRVVSREMIIDEIWANQDTLPTQTTLDVYIRRIRVMLEKYGKCIVTKRGFGYMLSDT